MTPQYRAARDARLKEAQAILDRMKLRHPAAFPVPLRPLKIGIREDLLAAGWTEDEVSVALGHYLRTKAYLDCTCVGGAFRIDLKGHPTAPVQDHEAQWALAEARGGPVYIPGGERNAEKHKR